MRTRVSEQIAPESTSFLLDTCGDGKAYKLCVMTSDAFDGVNYEATFETEPDHCALIELPISEFKPTWHGRPVPSAPALKAEDIRQMAILISDRQYGEFALAVKEISTA